MKPDDLASAIALVICCIGVAFAAYIGLRMAGVG